MGYIGKAHQSTSVPARTVSMLTGDGTTTTLTLSQAPMSANNVSVFFDGVAQTPGTDYTLSGSTLTFTSVPPAACVVCAIVGGGENISSPMGGSITAESIVAGAITNAKIANVAASKLTGAAFPALDASNVTFAVQQNLFTKSAADPTETSNVTLGTIWVNTLSGEIFVCIDATTDENSFINVGTGTLSILGNVIPGEPTDNVPDMLNSTSVSHTFTGGTDDDTVTHYHVDQISDVNLLSVAAAEVAAGSPHVFTTTSVVNDTDVTFRVRTKDNDGAYSNGITVTVSVLAPLAWLYQGRESGYITGGWFDNVTIQKMDFATDHTSVDHGDAFQGGTSMAGSSGMTHGHHAGGRLTSHGAGVPYWNQIGKFAYASSAGSTQIGTLTNGVEGAAGCSTEAYGHTVGGRIEANHVNQYICNIDRYSHVSSGNAVDVGDSIPCQYYAGGRGGHSSTTHGYAVSLSFNQTYSIIITKFSFSNLGTAVQVGQLTHPRQNTGTCSSSTHGYVMSGYTATGGYHRDTAIEKYPFASGGTTVVCGDLTSGAQNTCGIGGETHGYACGGYDPYTPINKFAYASESTVVVTGDLSASQAHGSGTQH